MRRLRLRQRQRSGQARSTAASFCSSAGDGTVCAEFWADSRVRETGAAATCDVWIRFRVVTAQLLILLSVVCFCYDDVVDAVLHAICSEGGGV